MYGFRYARITLFLVLKWIGAAGGFAGGLILASRWFGFPGDLIGGLVGLVAGLFIASMPEYLTWRYYLRKFERISVPELRAFVDDPQWNLLSTMALLQLDVRGEDIQRDLPRILTMLESDSVRERLFAQDALRWVYTELAMQSAYNAEESTALCRTKIACLRADLGRPAEKTLPATGEALD